MRQKDTTLMTGEMTADELQARIAYKCWEMDGIHPLFRVGQIVVVRGEAGFADRFGRVERIVIVGCKFLYDVKLESGLELPFEGKMLAELPIKPGLVERIDWKKTGDALVALVWIGAALVVV